MNNSFFRFTHQPKIVQVCILLIFIVFLSLFHFVHFIWAESDINYVFPLETATETATSTLTPTSTEQATPTQTSSSTPSSTATAEVAFTETPTEIPLPTGTATGTEISPNDHTIFAPVITNHFLVQPIEIKIEDYLICDSLSSPLNIPDNDPSGVEEDIVVVDEDLIVDIEVYLNLDHTWVGDLQVSLSSDTTGQHAVLIDRPGIPGSNLGCGLDNIRTILDDQASQPAESKCLNYPAAIAGIYRPSDPMSVFRGLPAAGIWTITLSDNSSADIGHLNNWCLHFSLSTRIPSPTPTPVPVELPDSARIYAISGQDQALPLDCESRSAVDWANYFGTSIGEFEFLYRLPTSDNPDLGFVGDVNGEWGQIPPYDYGVHADPVADLLNDFGVNAKARKSLTWDDIRREISESRPVLTWVIGSVINGAPNYYSSQSSPKSSIVARYEHTVIVIGYTPDSVIILDGDDIYSRPLDRLLESWSALNNMAVLAGSPEK